MCSLLVWVSSVTERYTTDMLSRRRRSTKGVLRLGENPPTAESFF